MTPQIASTRRIQVALLASVVITLVVTPIWLGFVALTGVVSVVSTALLVINLLLSSRDEPQPLLRLVQERLNRVGQLRLFAAVTGVTAIVTIAMAAVATYRAYERRYQVAVTGFVQKSDGSPAANCYVAANGAPESIDVSLLTGAFRLKLDRRRAVGGVFSVEARCGSESAFARFRVNSAPTPLFLRLPKRIPLSVRYIQLTGYGFDQVAHPDGHN